MRFSYRWGAPRPALLLPPLKPNPLDPLCFSYWNQLHCFKGWRWDQGSSFIISLSLLGGKRRYSLSPVNLAETKAIWLSALQLFLVLLLKNEWVQLLVWLLYIDFFFLPLFGLRKKLNCWRKLNGGTNSLWNSWLWKHLCCTLCEGSIKSLRLDTSRLQ